MTWDKFLLHYDNLKSQEYIFLLFFHFERMWAFLMLLHNEGIKCNLLQMQYLCYTTFRVGFKFKWGRNQKGIYQSNSLYFEKILLYLVNWETEAEIQGWKMQRILTQLRLRRDALVCNIHHQTMLGLATQKLPWTLKPSPMIGNTIPEKRILIFMLIKYP